MAKEKAGGESDNPLGNAKPDLPAGFELGSGARVVATYHILWPDEALAKLSDPKPSLLEIYYVRAEETNKPKKAIGLYSRQAQARVADARTIDKTTWFENSRMDPQTDRRRSVDVLITRPDDRTGGATKDDEEADLIVEILTIEIKDPASRE